MKKFIALLLAVTMLLTTAGSGPLTAFAKAGEEPDTWEERLDALDGIYTNPAQSPPPNVYMDDNFDDAALEELTAWEPYGNFLSTRDHEIVDRFGEPYLIKAIALDNNIGFSISYSNYNPYPKDGSGTNCHTEHTYTQLKELGFNSTRFLMHLNWFNDDLYERNEDGTIKILDGEKVINWDNPGLNWIRRNIEWAEKNDIRLILNMHYYQKQLWERQKDTVLPEGNGTDSGAKIVMKELNSTLMEAFGWRKYGISYDFLSEAEFYNRLCKNYNDIIQSKALYDLNDSQLQRISSPYSEAQLLELEYRVYKLASEKYQRQLLNAWSVISKMVKSRDTIIGYGLLNEPIPNLQYTQDGSGNYTADEEATLAQWERLAQEAASAVRAVDQKHILFVERLQDIANQYRGAGHVDNTYNIYTRIADDVEIDDSNYAYEVHTYVPYFLSHIPCSDSHINREELGNYYWNIKNSFDSGIQELKYPNDDIVTYYSNYEGGVEPFLITPADGQSPVENPSIPLNGNKENTWQRYNTDHSIRYKVEKQEGKDVLPNMAQIIFTVEDLGGKREDQSLGRGHVMFDNVVLKAHYTEDGVEKERVISSIPFGTSKEYWWSNNSKVGVKYHHEGGCALTGRDSLIACFPEGYPDLLDRDEKNGCLEIANRTGKNSVQISLQSFYPKEGYEYSVSADMKYTNEEGVETQAKACVELSFYHCRESYTLGREYLKKNLNLLKQIGTKEKKDAQGNVTEVIKRPVFLGECGMCTSSLMEYDFSDVGEGKTYPTYYDKMLALNNYITAGTADWTYPPVQVTGGQDVLADLFDILESDAKSEFPVGFDFHSYRGRTFGFYTDATTSPPVYKKYMNRNLARLFLEKLPYMNPRSFMLLEKGSNMAFVNSMAAVYRAPLAEVTDGTGMAALRPVCEALGLNVVWNQAENSVTVTKPYTGEAYTVTVGSNIIHIIRDGTASVYTMQKQAFSANGMIYVPVREFMGLLGCQTVYYREPDGREYFYISNQEEPATEEDIPDIILRRSKALLLSGDSAMLPVRYVAECLGMTVSWPGEASGIIEITSPDTGRVLHLQTGSKMATLIETAGGEEKTVVFPAAPTVIDGSTYVSGTAFLSFMGVDYCYMVDEGLNPFLLHEGSIIPLQMRAF